MPKSRYWQMRVIQQTLVEWVLSSQWNKNKGQLIITCSVFLEFLKALLCIGVEYHCS